jgi:hypothetical protein
VAVFNKYRVPSELQLKTWGDDLLETTKTHCRDASKAFTSTQLQDGREAVKTENAALKAKRAGQAAE